MEESVVPRKPREESVHEEQRQQSNLLLKSQLKTKIAFSDTRSLETFFKSCFGSGGIRNHPGMS